MSAFTRWRLATPLIILSLLCLGATLLGAWAYWSQDSAARNAVTVLLALMFGTNVALSVSIGVDRKIEDVPWLRIGTIVLGFALGCGVAVLRDSL